MKNFTRSMVVSFLVSMFYSYATGQSCSGDITLSTQAEVDNFTCERLKGNLTISGSDITNLDALHDLEIVTGYIAIINNPMLSKIDGFSSLQGTSGIRIDANASLTVIDGFSSLDTVSYAQYGPLLFSINNNPNLIKISGFRALRSITSGGGLNFSISSNAHLTLIDGFTSLNLISGGTSASFLISDNDALENINGFSNFKTLFGYGSCGFIIRNNKALLNINGFSALRSILSLNPALDISENKSLTNVDGLSSLINFGGRPGKITVANNIHLERCCGLYLLLTRVPPPTYHTVNISGNGAGCTLEDILAAGPCMDFEAGKSAACAMEELTFRFSSILPVSGLQWNFGEGAIPATATGPGPHKVYYETAGSKGIVLTANEPLLLTREKYMTIHPNPKDKEVVAEYDMGCDEQATNIIVVDYEPGIEYLLRNDEDDIPEAGPWPGYIGLYTGVVTKTTTYNVLATNPNTGCEAVMTVKPTVTIYPSPRDADAVAEYPFGHIGHATNILILDWQPDILYRLRNDIDNSPVAGPWPGDIGLYTGPLMETTTFNILAVDPETGCERQLSAKPTVTISSDPASKMDVSTSTARESTPDLQQQDYVQVYPNPSHGFFQLEIYNEYTGLFELHLYGLSGNVVKEEILLKSKGAFSETFDVNTVPDGIYLLSIVFPHNTRKPDPLIINKRLLILN